MLCNPFSFPIITLTSSNSISDIGTVRLCPSEVGSLEGHVDSWSRCLLSLKPDTDLWSPSGFNLPAVVITFVINNQNNNHNCSYLYYPVHAQLLFFQTLYPDKAETSIKCCSESGPLLIQVHFWSSYKTSSSTLTMYIMFRTIRCFTYRLFATQLEKVSEFYWLWFSA